MQLKPKSTDDFTRTLETDILPVLRQQAGFKDEISLVNADGTQALAISLWDRRESADAYSRNAYPQVLSSLAKVVEGTPEVVGYEVSNSTFHKIAARN
jgi:hypothetical protein